MTREEVRVKEYVDEVVGWKYGVNISRDSFPRLFLLILFCDGDPIFRAKQNGENPRAPRRSLAKIY